MNTYGWDIVYGCSKRVVNKHLEDYITKNKVEFLYSNTAKKQEIKMVFDNWEIINGGSSNFLRIKTPIKEGYFKVKNTTIDLSGVNPVLEIKLDFLMIFQILILRNLNLILDLSLMMILRL